MATKVARRKMRTIKPAAVKSPRHEQIKRAVKVVVSQRKKSR